MIGAADEFAAGDRLLQDGDRVVGLADGYQGAAEADLDRDGGRMVRPERARAAVEDPLEPRDGLRRLPGCH